MSSHACPVRRGAASFVAALAKSSNIVVLHLKEPIDPGTRPHAACSSRPRLSSQRKRPLCGLTLAMTIDTTPPNPFENAVGSFWLFHGTRPYMRARHDYVSTLLNIRTGEAVEAALDNCLGMLHLCRGDNLGVRSMIPALYLRLGRDQDAYDFIKWYAVKATSTYEWRNMDLPFLELHGEDALEPVQEKPLHIELSFFVALTLIKIRLMEDLMSLQGFVEKNPNSTTAARMEHLKEEAMSDVLLSREDIVVQGDYRETIAEMRRQAIQLYEQVKGMNQHFWLGVLNPDRYANSVPGIYTMGSPEEAVLVFRYSWYSWSETEPAIQFIRGIIQEDIGSYGN